MTVSTLAPMATNWHQPTVLLDLAPAMCQYACHVSGCKHSSIDPVNCDNNNVLFVLYTICIVHLLSSVFLINFVAKEESIVEFGYEVAESHIDTMNA